MYRRLILDCIFLLPAGRGLGSVYAHVARRRELRIRGVGDGGEWVEVGRVGYGLEVVAAADRDRSVCGSVVEDVERIRIGDWKWLRTVWGREEEDGLEVVFAGREDMKSERTN